MSRTLKRPMFRRGGQVNDGIMTGIVDREQKKVGDIAGRARELTPELASLLEEFTPQTRLPLGQFGLNLASGKFAGDGALQNIVGSARDPYAQFTKADDARERAIKSGAVKLGIGQAMKESAPSKNILMNRKKAIVNLQAQEIELTPENIIRETARLNKLEETGKGISPDRVFQGALAANEGTYGSTGPKAYNATVWSKRISPKLRQQGRTVGGNLRKNKDGSYKKPKTADAYYIDLDLGEVIYFDGASFKRVTEQYAELFQ